jgi:excisionase family DNA binding protein
MYQEKTWYSAGLLQWYGTSACRTGMRNTLLPCRVGFVRKKLIKVKILVMENPFELILKKLDTIEQLLKNAPKPIIQTKGDVREVLNLEQAAEYVSLSKSAIYKKTAERTIPHFKQGKKLYFRLADLNLWLTELKISTKAEIEKQANDYLMRKRKNRF